jgi:hypothetical protein
MGLRRRVQLAVVAIACLTPHLHLTNCATSLDCRCELVPVHMDAHGIIPAHLDQVMTQRQAGGLPLPRCVCAGVVVGHMRCAAANDNASSTSS